MRGEKKRKKRRRQRDSQRDSHVRDEMRKGESSYPVCQRVLNPILEMSRIDSVREVIVPQQTIAETK
jgi:hypothetical protein